MTAILHVISGLGMGGAERNLVQVGAGLRSRGLTQHVASVGQGDVWASALEESGIGVTRLGVASMIDAPLGLVRLTSLVRRLQPDVIQGWMYHGDLFAALAHRLTPGRQRRLLWGLRASDTDKGGYGAIVAVNARLSAWPDIVVANSQAGLDYHRGRGYRPRKAEVIPNGIDVHRFKPDAVVRSEVRAALGIPADALVAVHVARNDPMKDHASFLAAMAALPPAQGILVGAGTETLTLPANVRALGLRRDVERLYAAADIVVSTSAYAEGFSNAIAEGMSAGLIPIATDVGDARVVVGDTGIVVPPRDAAAVSAAIGTVIPLLPSERIAQGLRARSRVVEQFSLDQAVGRYERLYRSLAAA